MDNQYLYALLLMASITLSCTVFSRGAAENVQLSALFSDNMVLQQQLPIPVWGTADPGGTVTVALNKQKVATRVDSDGKWMVRLSPLEAGGPHELIVSGKDTLVFKDVLIGEVWLGSGQSNMEMPLAGWGKVLNYKKEIAEADYPQIRLLQVARRLSFTPEERVPSEGWQVCTPENIHDFSSTAYFFGRKIHKSLNIPVGLIHSSWGGTIIEAWTRGEALKTLPAYVSEVEQIENAVKSDTDGNALQQKFEKAVENWKHQIDENDAGFRGNWFEKEIDDSEWQVMRLPIAWEKAGLPDFDGVVWFRKTLILDNTGTAADAELHLGPIDDVDSTYFNGVYIGGQSEWDEPRIYTVPKSYLREGENVITVRVVDFQGGGGLWGEPGDLKLTIPGKKAMPLAGDWRFKVGLNLDDISDRPVDPQNPNRPTVLYNAMIEPLIPYGIRGVIWYQGESNANEAFRYRKLFPLMIKDWRERWGQGDFPFLFVQLANWLEREKSPTGHPWAELREAQAMALDLPNTGMAVAIDIGDAYDIHPKNKQEVGRRLARHALKMAYGKDVKNHSPMFASMERNERGIIISFKHVYDGLTTVDGNAVQGFAIAGSDKKFYRARADVIDSNRILVWHPDISEPDAVRYAWEVNPEVNLINSEGLPAAPFRTDNWPGITQD